jgi:hypothetical protein
MDRMLRKLGYEGRADYSDCAQGDGGKISHATTHCVPLNPGYGYFRLRFGGRVVFTVALWEVARVVNFPIDGFRVVDGFTVLTAAALFVVNDSCHTLTVAQVAGRKAALAAISASPFDRRRHPFASSPRVSAMPPKHS